MHINNISFGIDYPPVIIAELGINHNGSIERAFKIVDELFTTNIKIIKHQTHIPDDEMSIEARAIKPGNSKESIYNIIKKCALSVDDEFKLKNYIETNGRTFISTPFSKSAVDRLEKFNVPAYKIGSGECNNLPLIEYISQKNRPIILSTGMNDLHTIKPTIEILKKNNNSFALLHTTNLYPTPYKLVRLGAITDMLKKFPDIPIGLSDHTLDNFASFGAVALGASIIERHFIDDKSFEGPDVICSMDAKELNELIKGTEILFLERGGNKSFLKEEQVTRNFAFASVVLKNDLKKNELLCEKNIWVMRPGNGEIPASKYKSLIGKKANKDLFKGNQLKFTDIE